MLWRVTIIGRHVLALLIDDAFLPVGELRGGGVCSVWHMQRSVSAIGRHGDVFLPVGALRLGGVCRGKSIVTGFSLLALRLAGTADVLRAQRWGP